MSQSNSQPRAMNGKFLIEKTTSQALLVLVLKVPYYFF